MKRKSLLIYLIVFSFIYSCNSNQESAQAQLRGLEETTSITVFPSFNLKIINYCLDSSHQQIDFFLVKNNLHPSREGYILDRDGDGLSDKFEDTLGPLDLDRTNKYSKKNNPPVVSDLILSLLGLTDLNVDELICPENTSNDSDSDGLNDCEEHFAGTNKDSWDSDGDSIPDEVELRMGLNPNFKDALLDTDGDGDNNVTEVKRNSAIDSQTLLTGQHHLAQSLAQKSLYEKLTLVEKGSNCFEFHLDNLPYVNSLNNNIYTFYFIKKLEKRLELTISTSSIRDQQNLQYNYTDSQFEAANEE
jgi:hypothetical protein